MRTFKHIFTIGILMFLFTHNSNAQELGYLSGVSKLGVKQTSYQPLYGFNIGKVFNKHIAIETNLFYSQRQVGETPQADYFTFSLIPQFGVFDENKKFGIYAAPSVALNPTLYHSNAENHTYVSAGFFVGGRYQIVKKIIVDVRGGYDYGLTGAYFVNNTYYTYKGIMAQVGLKFDLSCK
jgi:hypothetical protein